MKIVPEEIFHPSDGKTLVCGSHVYETRSDRRALYQNVIGVDVIDGPGVDVIGDLTDKNLFNDQEFSHIDCVSMLEHCKNPWLAAVNMMGWLKKGGTILFSSPLVWRYHGYPNDYWRFTHEGVGELFSSIEWTFLKTLSNNQWVTKMPVIKSQEPLFHRCEVVGWGIKC